MNIFEKIHIQGFRRLLDVDLKLNALNVVIGANADRLIRFLKPAEVLTVNIKDDGASEFTRADELDLDKWLEEYTLDEVWRMGRIGGRS